MAMYQKRFYREIVKEKDLVGFRVSCYDSDLQIYGERELRKEALLSIKKARESLDVYIQRHPEFFSALKPLPLDETADDLIQGMMRGGEIASVGPMAAVAGAIAEFAVRALSDHMKEVIIENGGDIFMISHKPRVVSVFAGKSPLSLKVGIKVPPHPEGVGICTSSGTVGHSISFGKSDATVVVADNTAIADACATAIGNMIKTPEDIKTGLQRAEKINEIRGALVVIGEHLGAWGEIELVRL